MTDAAATTELSLTTVARVHDITSMFHALVYFAPEAVEETIAQLAAKNCRAYRLGEIVPGEQKVELQGALAW